MDYWICDRDGKPFFVVTAVGTEGMIRDPDPQSGLPSTPPFISLGAFHHYRLFFS
jgi:hypothetical protein